MVCLEIRLSQSISLNRLAQIYIWDSQEDFETHSESPLTLLFYGENGREKRERDFLSPLFP